MGKKALLLLLLVLITRLLFTQTNKTTLLFVGDFMQHSPQVNSAIKQGIAPFYQEAFQFIKKDIEAADYAIFNLETTFSPPPYSGYPQFSAPFEVLDQLKDIGFDMAVTANNHIFDKGGNGVIRTLNYIHNLGIESIGTYHSAEEQSAKHPNIIVINGIKIAFVSFTYSSNQGVASPFRLNVLRENEIINQLELLNTLTFDISVALVHWGEEYQLQPSVEQIKYEKLLKQYGVNIIVGSHPHVPQPLKVQKSIFDLSIQSLTCYSLGNFLSNQSIPFTQIGRMLKITLFKVNSKVYILSFENQYNWVDRTVTPFGRKYRITPYSISERPIDMNLSEWTKMQKELMQLELEVNTSVEFINPIFHK